MRQGEQDLSNAVLARLEALMAALDEDVAVLQTVPTDMETFRAMDTTRRVASRALLKSVEQTEDQLARLFRLLPAMLLVDASDWFAQDYANFAEKLKIIDDSFAWTAVIKLRNRLVHDYPLRPDAQLDLLTQAHAAVPLLRQTSRRARAFVESRIESHD